MSNKKNEFDSAVYELFGIGDAESQNQDSSPSPESSDDVGEGAYMDAAPSYPAVEPQQEESSWPEEQKTEPAPFTPRESTPVASPESSYSYSKSPSAERQSGGERTYIAKGTKLEGTLHTNSDVEIWGDFKGEIASNGEVMICANTQSSVSAASLVLSNGKIIGDVTVKNGVSIDEGSSIAGNIRATTVECSGIVRGNLNVSQNLVLGPSSQIMGDIKTNTLEMSTGARITGRVDMGLTGGNDEGKR